MNKDVSTRRDSLAFRSRLSVTVTAVALLLTLTLTNLYSFQLLRQNMRDSMISSSQLFASDLQDSLDTCETGAWELVSLAVDAQTLPVNGDLGEYLTGKDILDELDERIAYVPSADIFYYSRPEQDQLFMSLNSRASSGTAYQWENYFRQGDDSAARVWNTVLQNGEYWLTLHFDVQHAQVGVTVRLSRLCRHLRENEDLLEETSYAFLDRSGKTIYSSNDTLFPLGDTVSLETLGQVTRLNGSAYMTESTCLDDGSALVFCRPMSQAIPVANSLFWWIVCLSAASLLVITMLLRNTNRQITRPISELSEAVHQVEQGNWSYRLEQQSPIFDFQHLFGGFNHMVQEVYNLKIAAYEAELERHRNELRYLQLQIRPHFYLNAITTISSLTYQGRTEDVRTFIDALGNYLRYLFSGKDTQATLEEEADHCQSFIQLQQIKYPDKIFFMLQISEEVRGKRIPKFLVQTAIENIFKHGFSPESFLSIFLEAGNAVVARNGHEVQGLQITVEDNGCGFPAEYLSSFPQPDDADHVGLNNLFHTLKLIYGDDADLNIANTESGGARVVFFIPEDGEQNESTDR